MASFQHLLRLGTVIKFGSLEFMSLGIEYDMILSRLSLSSAQAPVAALLIAGGRDGATGIVPLMALHALVAPLGRLMAQTPSRGTYPTLALHPERHQRHLHRLFWHHLLRCEKRQFPTPLSERYQPHWSSHPRVGRSRSLLGETWRGSGENRPWSSPSPTSQASTPTPSQGCMSGFLFPRGL
jgi:hypothetical protein